MQSPFGFANVEILTVPTTSFIYNFGHLRTVEPVFVKGKETWCDVCFGKWYLIVPAVGLWFYVNAPVTFIYKSRELFGNNVALQP